MSASHLPTFGRVYRLCSRPSWPSPAVKGMVGAYCRYRPTMSDLLTVLMLTMNRKCPVASSAWPRTSRSSRVATAIIDARSRKLPRIRVKLRRGVKKVIVRFRQDLPKTAFRTAGTGSGSPCSDRSTPRRSPDRKQCDASDGVETVPEESVIKRANYRASQKPRIDEFWH